MVTNLSSKAVAEMRCSNTGREISTKLPKALMLLPYVSNIQFGETHSYCFLDTTLPNRLSEV